MWFLDDSVKQDIEKAVANGLSFTASDIAEFEAHASEKAVDSVSGKTAVIKIDGIMTEKPDIIAALFGGGNTTYRAINGALQAAETNSDIDNIDLRINSPGGNIDGMFAALDAIKNTTKPVRAIVGNRALSAAYMLASQANEIFATSRASMFGSNGVAFEKKVDSEQIQISNTESPDKRPDLKTEEGKEIVRAQLDEIYNLASEYVANGRGTTIANVNKNFGRGRVVLAEQALKAGMIDGILDTPVVQDKQQQTANGGKTAEVRSMDLAKLKAEHPDVYAAAVAEERGRVCAHLKMGESSGDMTTALEAIKNGLDMTAEILATYHSAVLNKASIEGRQADNVDLKDTPAEPKADDFGAKVAQAMEGSYQGIMLGENGEVL